MHLIDDFVWCVLICVHFSDPGPKTTSFPYVFEGFWAPGLDGAKLARWG